MATNIYLDLLGLQPGATKEEVKAAYRKLSKVYHPDINKSPDAKEKFIQINEAYNFLMRVGPAPHNEAVRYDYDPYTAEFERRRWEARERARKAAMEESRMKFEMIGQLLAYFKFAGFIILGFNFFLTLDYLIPFKEYEQKIISTRIIKVGGGRYNRASTQKYDEIKFEDINMRFNLGEVDLRSDYSHASVLTTRLFNVPMAAKITVDGVTSKYEQSYNVYKVYGFLIPGIFLLMGFYLYWLKNPEHKLTIALLIIFLSFVQLIFFFKF
jgi:hypothetical protein